MAQTLKSRNSRPPWKIVISAKLASQCRAVANDVARRLIDGDLLKRNIHWYGAAKAVTSVRKGLTLVKYPLGEHALDVVLT
ncbi:hypothetical protein BH10CYA1_BH10CYA1_03910 [soil metagenome]